MNPCSGICSPEPRLSAIRPSFAFADETLNSLRADDRVRTGDLNLGKVPRYQLRYVRILRGEIYRIPIELAHPPISLQAGTVQTWIYLNQSFGWMGN